MLHKEITDRIICAFFKVYNYLGPGFLEKVYENALGIELRKLGLLALQQQPLTVFYEGEMVGYYQADIVVSDVVILELKAAESLRQEHYAQLTNYLKATEKEVGLVLNFGPKPEFKRLVLSNDVKPHCRSSR